MRPAAACTASASASSTRCRPRPSSRWRATASSIARPSRAAFRPRRWRISARPEPARHHPRLHARPEIFGDDARSGRRGSTGWRAPRPICSPGVEIRWRCDPELISDETPAEAVFQFPGGLADHLKEQIGEREDGDRRRRSSAGRTSADEQGSVEWAVAWPVWGDGNASYYCNTIPTPDGGTHEQGLRNALTRGLRAFGELVGQKKAKDIQAEDAMTGAEIMLSVFIRDPQFQSQTKDRLTSPDAARLVENAVRDHFDHFLADHMERGRAAARLRARPDGRAPEAPGRARDQAQDRDLAPQGPAAGQADRLRQRRSGGHRIVHRRGRFRRRLGQAGARPQDPGDPADPRQDPERRLGDRRQDPRQPGDRRPDPGAGLRHPRPLPIPTTSATSGS